jgi:hypothetical protein
MQPEHNLAESLFVRSEVKNSRPGKNLHYVFIADKYGINSAFELIKFKLGNELNSCLTLIYSIHQLLPLPLYKSELKMLERRFPSKFIACYVISRNTTPPDNFEMNQQIIEIVINSNTSGFMQFLILGQEEFIGMVADRLHFLGIKSNHIRSLIF